MFLKAWFQILILELTIIGILVYLHMTRHLTRISGNMTSGSFSQVSIYSSIRAAGSKGIFVEGTNPNQSVRSSQDWPIHYLEPTCNVVHANTFCWLQCRRSIPNSGIVHMNDFRGAQDIINFVEAMRPYFKNNTNLLLYVSYDY